MVGPDVGGHLALWHPLDYTGLVDNPVVDEAFGRRRVRNGLPAVSGHLDGGFDPGLFPCPCWASWLG